MYNYPADKFYWGHYLNLALHNVAVTMQHITDACKLVDFVSKDGNPTKITEDFLNLEKQGAAVEKHILAQFAEKMKGKPEKQRHLKTLLLKHFTYLYYHQKNDDTVDYVFFLKDVLEKFTLINHRRNFCSHAVHKELHLLDFRASPFVEITEERKKNFSSEILAKAKNEIVKNTVLYPKYEQDEGYRKKCIAPLADADFDLFETKNDAEGEPTFAATEKGLAFMACLFLPRSDAYLFLNRIKGFQKTDFQIKNADETLANLQWQAAFDCFTHYYIRLPFPKLESSDPRLDLFNELTRCPPALFNALTDDARQQHFLHKSHNAEDVNEDYDASIGGSWHRRGTDDRFPYFALRYLDAKNALGEARFQLQLGRVQIGKVYKKIMLGISQDRRLLKEIMVFDHLKTYLDRVQSRDPLLTNDDKLEETKRELFGEAATHIEQFSPKYNIANNNVAIRFEPSDMEELKTRMQRFKQKIHGKKYTILADQEEADAFLSVHELPNLAFYYHLYQNKHAAVAPIDIIKNYRKQFLKFFEAVQNGSIKPFTNAEGKNFLRKAHPALFSGGTKGKKPTTAEDVQWFEKHLERVDFRTNIIQKQIMEAGFDLILIKNLPDALRNYLLGYTDDNVYHTAKERVKTKIRETKRILAELEKNEGDDFSTFSPKVGDIANRLTNDLKYFQPYNDAKENKGRPNNDQAVKLQAMLSQFGAYKTELWAYFRELGMVRGDYKDTHLAHPFLGGLERSLGGNIYGFYKDYLNARLAFLNKFMKLEKIWNEKKSKNEMQTVCTIKTPADLQKNEYWLKIKVANALTKNYTNDKQHVATQLPRGLFNAAIVNALQNVAHCKDKIKTSDTMTHCVSEYMQGDTQPFYDEAQVPRVFWYKRKGETDATPYTTAQLKQIAYDLANPKPKRVIVELFGTMVETLKEGIVTQADKAEIEFIEKTLLHKTIAERDKKIRYAQTCDRIAFLMLKDWFSTGDINIESDALTLNDCFLPPNLNRQTDPFARQSFLDKPFEMKVTIGSKTITTVKPLYAYGIFRRFMKDARVSSDHDSLLTWYDTDRIELEQLETELKYYNEHRHEVLGEIVTMENRFVTAEKVSIYQKDEHGIDTNVSLQYLDHPPYLIATILTPAHLLELRQICKNIVNHTHTIYSSITGKRVPVPATLQKVSIATFIQTLSISPEILQDGFMDKIVNETTKRYSTLRNVTAAVQIEAKLLEECEKFFIEIPHLKRLKMLRNKFAHNQIRYDANIRLDKTKLITAELIKYTTEQYKAL